MGGLCYFFMSACYEIIVGQDLLLGNYTVQVWNVDLEEHQAIMKVGCGGFISAHFSPDSLKLMTTCSSPCFKYSHIH